MYALLMRRHFEGVDLRMHRLLSEHILLVKPRPQLPYNTARDEKLRDLGTRLLLSLSVAFNILRLIVKVNQRCWLFTARRSFNQSVLGDLRTRPLLLLELRWTVLGLVSK